ILCDRSPEKMKLDESGHAAQIGLARRPDVFEGCFRTQFDLKSVHRDKHFDTSRCASGATCARFLETFVTERAALGTSAQLGGGLHEKRLSRCQAPPKWTFKP